MKLAKKHPATVTALVQWFRVAKKAKWQCLREVRQVFPSVDQVGDVLIFNIMGGGYRLIVRVSYPAQTIYVKAVLNHREYDRKEWMKWA